MYWGLRGHRTFIHTPYYTNFFHFQNNVLFNFFMNLIAFCSIFPGKRFQTLINLSMHIKGVHEGFDFRINHICNLCDMPFPNKITLLSHKRRDHETYKCEICYRVFPNEIIFRSHVATSHSGKKHRCENCTRTYCDKWSLIHHMIEDHGAKHLLQRKNQGPKCPYIKM